MPEMRAGILSCPRCRTPLPGSRYTDALPFPCSGCRRELRVQVYPALYRGPAPARTGEVVANGSEASCFYHPRKKAAVICAVCGRFLCSLCEVQLAGRCLCPSCIDSGRQKEGLVELVTERPLHDGIALALAIAPMLFVFATIVTAPIAIYYSIRHWRSPGSILPRSRIRLVAAIVIAFLQLAGWSALLVTAL
jgi:hypothetical protein